jgi:Ras-related GTP-binding protein A/B
MQKQKVLLMGRSGSGKTSMRSIIFANYIARDTSNFEPTIEIDTAQVRFLGNLSLMLWDCGGQEAFIESYFSLQKDHLFHNVAVLIFVFDVESESLKKETAYFRSCVEALLKHSPDAQVFCLVHKMDLLPESKATRVFAKRRSELEKIAHPLRVHCFGTSIWDETLYKAWSQIVYALIPNVATLERHLSAFCRLCEADEMVLFERATFLVISHASADGTGGSSSSSAVAASSSEAASSSSANTSAAPSQDVHRFEKISNIVKQFKLSCSKMGTHFSNFEVRNSRYSAFMDELTKNAYVLLIFNHRDQPNAIVSSPAILANIRSARKHFSPLLEE